MNKPDDKLNSEIPETLWFLARGDVLMGPFTVNQIAEKVSSREFSALDYCWRQGFSEWRPINSVEEFDRRGKIRTLSPYPTAELPGIAVSRNRSEGQSLADGNSKHQIAKKTGPVKKEKIEITFAKVRRGPLSIYEWAGALIFCLVFSYFSVDFALNEVEKSLLTRLQFIRTGQLKTEGYVPTTSTKSPVTPLWMWDPLLSAPGIKEVNQLETRTPAEIGMPSLPKNFVRYYHQENQMTGSVLQSGRGPASETTFSLNVDPMIKGRVQYQGVLSITDKAEVKITPVGSPETQFP